MMNSIFTIADLAILLLIFLRVAATWRSARGDPRMAKPGEHVRTHPGRPKKGK